MTWDFTGDIKELKRNNQGRGQLSPGDIRKRPLEEQFALWVLRHEGGLYQVDRGCGDASGRVQVPRYSVQAWTCLQLGDQRADLLRTLPIFHSTAAMRKALLSTGRVQVLDPTRWGHHSLVRRKPPWTSFSSSVKESNSRTYLRNSPSELIHIRHVTQCLLHSACPIKGSYFCSQCFHH